METMHDHSTELGALAKSLAAAQAAMTNAKLDAVNPHFKNRYATLSSVRAAVTPTLAAHGLALVQTFEPHGADGVCVVTTLMHESGQWLRSRLYLPVGKKDAQGFGSAISYGRRYALAAICGIAADDDDDGEGAVREPSNGTAKPSAAKAIAQASTEAEERFARALDDVATPDALAKVEAEVARAVQAGALTDASRARLRARRAEAVKRLSSGASAA